MDPRSLIRSANSYVANLLSPASKNVGSTAKDRPLMSGTSAADANRSVSPPYAFAKNAGYAVGKAILSPTTNTPSRPGGQTGGRRYSVQAGDSLSKIAAKELGAANRWPEIQSVNHLINPNMIHAGMTLLLPADSASTQVAACVPPMACAMDAAPTSDAGQCVQNGPYLTAPTGPTRKPQKGDRADAYFQASLRAGNSEVAAFFQTLWSEPGSTGWIFLEAFVESDLEPFSAPFKSVGEGLSMVPDKKFQELGQLVSGMGNGIDAFVGLVKGDKEKTKNALIDFGVDVLVDAATKTLKIKTADGRISPLYRNAQGELSKTAREVLFNNLVIWRFKHMMTDLIKTLQTEE